MTSQEQDDTKSIYRHSVIHFQNGQYAKALPYAEMFCTRAAAEYGKDSEAHATGLTNLGLIRLYSGITGEAEEPLLQAYHLCKGREPTSLDVADCAGNLGECYRALGDFERAHSYMQETCDIREEILGRYHPLYAQSLNNLASVSESHGDLSKAESLLNQALDIITSTKEKNGLLHASILNNLGSISQERGRYNTAEQYYLQALELREENLGRNHPDVATTLGNLSTALEQKGDYLTADSYVRRALQIREESLGPHHHRTASLRMNCAAVCQATGDYPGAERCLISAKDDLRKLGIDHPHYITCCVNLAALHHLMGRYGEADRALQTILARAEEIAGTTKPWYAGACICRADLLRSLGSLDEAEELYRTALDVIIQIKGEHHPEIGPILNNMALISATRRDYAKAEQMIEAALNSISATHGTEHPDFAAALTNAGEIERGRGNFRQAEEAHLESLAIREKNPGQSSLVYATGLRNLAELYLFFGRYDEAHRYAIRALQIRTELLESHHRDIADIQKILGCICAANSRYFEAINYFLIAAPSDDNLKKQIQDTGVSYERSTVFYAIDQQINLILSLLVLIKNSPDNIVQNTYNLVLKRKEHSSDELPYTCVYTTYDFSTTGISGKSPWGEDKTVQFIKDSQGTTKLVRPQNL